MHILLENAQHFSTTHTFLMSVRPSAISGVFTLHVTPMLFIQVSKKHPSTEQKLEFHVEPSETFF